MSELRPLTDLELTAMECLAGYDLGVHAEDGDRERLRSMVHEIRMHRDAMAPAALRAVRLYTDELGALRKRVAELEAGLPAAWVAMSDEQRHALTSECCRGCGSLDTSCQCENDE